jgi:hypothetical protein
MIWLISVDLDDSSVNIHAIEETLLNQRYEVVQGNSMSKIEAINRDVNLIGHSWDILLNISDDQEPITKGYDNIIRNLMPDNLDASLWLFDGRNRIVNTQEIIGRKYYDRFGYIYHPSYKSLYCDNEATELAQILGKQIKSSKCIIRHIHPFFYRHLKYDALYIKNDAFKDIDKANYLQRKAINFGL